jgi:hypothetical protein
MSMMGKGVLPLGVQRMRSWLRRLRKKVNLHKPLKKQCHEQKNGKMAKRERMMMTGK